MRCDQHHYYYNKKIINSISNKKTCQSFSAFTREKTKQKKIRSYIQKKPQNLQKYYRIECYECNYILYSKATTTQPNKAKEALMNHYIFCPQFNKQYIEEFQTKQFSITTLKQYARVYACNA